MITKKRSKKDLFKAIFGSFLVIIGLFVGVFGTVLGSNMVYAEPGASEEGTGDNSDSGEAADENETTDDNADENETTNDNTDENEEPSDSDESSETHSILGTEALSPTIEEACKNALGEIKWLACPATDAVANAVNWLYDKIEGALEVEPAPMEDGSPIYEIWKYCLSVTNVVFVIFLLVVIYSQLTGIGISNYGVKKVLPKLIITAILVNLSFLVCSLAVDVSNMVGNGLRGVFETVESSVMANSAAEMSTEDIINARIAKAKSYSSMAGVPALALLGGVVAFETGAIWMLIPVLLGAVVAVVSGLVTIALRQAVVALLIMISPLAIVACILPNTEKWFKKWEDLLIKMLVFYPMFSLLFGASSLAGFAIAASAKGDEFGILLGTAVQIFPLFFSWNLMKMSGTFLGTINAKMRSLAAKPLATNRAWAESHRMASKQRHLAASNAYTPSMWLMRFVSDRKVAREAEINEKSTLIKERGLAYRARRNYKNGDIYGGILSRKGERTYEQQAEVMEYQQISMRDKNNFNKGFRYLAEEGTDMWAKYDRLDARNMNASDRLKAEQARGEEIEYRNAKGFHERMEAAINAHMDFEHGFEDWRWEEDEDGNMVRVGKKSNYKFHMDPSKLERSAELARYNATHKIMEGNVGSVQYAAAVAAHGYDTQRKIVETKMQKYFDNTVPTKDLEYRLGELTKIKGAANNIDFIVPGLRILNQRGDTNLVKEQLYNLLDVNIGGGVELGTHASQALASFLMFEVKDNDPWLRRFGKYINLETANVYNKNKRKVMNVTYDEYIKGYHYEPDPDDPGQMKIMYAKRTALASYDDSLLKAYTDETGNLDYDAYIKKRGEVDKAFGPAFISASMKYLSGSEQIASAVRSKTGYSMRQNPDGTHEMVPIWEDKDYKKKFAGHEEDIEKWYRERTLAYLSDQTPLQILGLRSDYRDSMAPHLFKEYQETDMEGWSEEAIEERRKIMEEWSDLQTREDLSTEEKQRETNRIKNKMAGAQLRQLLDSKGKLNQIYLTRESGVANNAKDWVREWLDLDNEAAIEAKLDKDGLKKKRHSSKTSRSGDGGAVYSDNDRADFVSQIDNLQLDTGKGEKFYDKSMEYVEKNLGRDSYIAARYKGYHEGAPSADDDTLKKFLKDLLSNPENY